MSVLLVTYELNNTDMDYSTFHSMLHSYPWIKLNDHALVLQVSETPNEFFEGIWPWVDQHDTVMVSEFDKNWVGICPEKVRTWLMEHAGQGEPVAA